MTQIENIARLLNAFVDDRFGLLLDDIHRRGQHVRVKVALHGKLAPSLLRPSEMDTRQSNPMTFACSSSSAGSNSPEATLCEINFGYIQIRQFGKDTGNGWQDIGLEVNR